MWANRRRVLTNDGGGHRLAGPSASSRSRWPIRRGPRRSGRRDRRRALAENLLDRLVRVQLTPAPRVKGKGGPTRSGSTTASPPRASTAWRWPDRRPTPEAKAVAPARDQFFRRKKSLAVPPPAPTVVNRAQAQGGHPRPGRSHLSGPLMGNGSPVPGNVGWKCRNGRPTLRGSSAVRATSRPVPRPRGGGAFPRSRGVAWGPGGPRNRSIHLSWSSLRGPTNRVGPPGMVLAKEEGVPMFAHVRAVCSPDPWSPWARTAGGGPRRGNDPGPPRESCPGGVAFLDHPPGDCEVLTRPRTQNRLKITVSRDAPTS